MKNIPLRNLIFALATILWCAVIFKFSAVPATGSTETSHTVGRLICETFYAGFGDLAGEEQDQIVSDIDLYVRKGAHLSEYALLGILVFGAVLPCLTRREKDGVRRLKGYTERPSLWKSGGLTVLVSALYAASDELHQTFVEGRAGRWTDVLIDTSGAFIGVLLCLAVISIVYAVDKKKNN